MGLSGGRHRSLPLDDKLSLQDWWRGLNLPAAFDAFSVAMVTQNYSHPSSTVFADSISK